MLTLRTITNANELDSFVEKSPFVHYMKTSMWAFFKQDTEHDQHDYLGFYREDQLIGTAMVLKNSWLGHRFLYIPWGPCLNYRDSSEVKEAFSLLQQYADQQNVQFLRVDPNVIRRHHEIDGTLIEDGYSGEAITEELKQLGFIHKGYGYAYNGSWTNRFTLIADLSEPMQEIINRYSKQRRTSLNRHRINGVATRIGDSADVPTLMEFEDQLSQQDGFAPHSSFFFNSLLSRFGSHAVLYVTEIHFPEMVENLEKELASGKYGKDPEAAAAKENELARARQLCTLYPNPKPVACGLFIRIGSTSWDLYTYSDKEFNSIKPVDNLHAFAMQDMKEHGVLHYDMCGFSGNTDKKDPYYGLYAYKRSFGPEYIEQIGEFDYVRNPSAMKRFRFEKLAFNHLKRSYWAHRYKKK